MSAFEDDGLESEQDAALRLSDTELAGDAAPQGPLFDGDIGQLPESVRRVLMMLLKRRYLSADDHPREWELVVTHEPLLRSRLNDLFFQLEVNSEYDVAFKRQAVSETGDKYPTLVADQTYSREETLLLFTLRRMLRSGQQQGQDAVFVDKRDLLDEVANFRLPSATDRSKDKRTAANAVDSLLRQDLLVKTNQVDRYRIPIVIEVLLPARELSRIDAWLTAQLAAETDPGEDPEDTSTQQPDLFADDTLEVAS